MGKYSVASHSCVFLCPLIHKYLCRCNMYLCSFIVGMQWRLLGRLCFTNWMINLIRNYSFLRIRDFFFPLGSESNFSPENFLLRIFYFLRHEATFRSGRPDWTTAIIYFGQFFQVAKLFAAFFTENFIVFVAIYMCCNFDKFQVGRLFP
jgi:hypothetical protein